MRLMGNDSRAVIDATLLFRALVVVWNLENDLDPDHTIGSRIYAKIVF